MSEEVKEAIMQFQTAIDFKTATVMPMEYSIDIENAKVLLKYIEQLQQENEELKEQYSKLEDKYIKNTPCCNENDCLLYKRYFDTEIILTEFEKWLETTLIIEKAQQTDKMYIKGFQECLDKLQELKEGKK